MVHICLLYTSDAADERSSVDLGGRRIIKKKTKTKKEKKRKKKEKKKKKQKNIRTDTEEDTDIQNEETEEMRHTQNKYYID